MYSMFIMLFPMPMQPIWEKKMLADDGIHIPMITTLHGTDITLVGSHPFYKKQSSSASTIPSM